MVMTDEHDPIPSDDAATIFSGGVRSGRTAAIIAETVRRRVDDEARGDERPAWIVVTRTPRIGDTVRRSRSALGAVGHDPDSIRVVTVEMIARDLVEAQGDLVAAVASRIIGSELARRTLVVQAIAAAALKSPWRLSAEELLASSVRVIDRLAQAGITSAEASRWHTDQVDRLDRRAKGDDAARHQSLHTLGEVARRRTDLLAIATAYERLKRERALLDSADVFRRATWLAERGVVPPDQTSWSFLAIDDLDHATEEERRLLDALRRGGATLAAYSVGLSSVSDGSLGELVSLGDTTSPADAIEQAFFTARTGDDDVVLPRHSWPGVRAEVFADEAAENSWIVDSVAKALEAGIDAGEIAVIALSPERLPAIERLMLDRSIPCRRFGQPLRAGSSLTGDLLAVADLLVDPADVVATRRLARSPRYLASRVAARDSSAPHGAEALAVDVTRWLRTAAERGPQHAVVEALGDLGIERVLAISHERWVSGELRAVRAELGYLDDPAHSQVTRSPATFRLALRSIVAPNGAPHVTPVDDRTDGCVSLVVAELDSTAIGSWDHVYLVGMSDEAVDNHHRLEDESLDPASLPLALLGDPLEVPLGAGGRTVEVLGRRMRRRRSDRSDAWLVGLARSARVSLSLSHAVGPRRTADVHETAATESRSLDSLKAAGLTVRRARDVVSSEGSRGADTPRQVAPPQGTSLLLVEGGIEAAIASHPEASRIRNEVAELVAYLTPDAEANHGGFAPRELSARELFLAETDPDHFVQEVMLDLPEPPSAATDRTARLRSWLELDASRRTDRDGLGVLVAESPTSEDPVEEMARLRGVDDRDLDLPGVGSSAAIADMVSAYRETPYGSMILSDAGRSLVVISQGRLVRSRLFGAVDQPDGIWQVIDVRVGSATALDWYRLGVQALALSSPSRSLGCCRLVVVSLGDQTDIEVRPSPSADHLTRRLALQWQIVDLVGS